MKPDVKAIKSTSGLSEEGLCGRKLRYRISVAKKVMYFKLQLQEKKINGLKSACVLA